MARRSPRPGRTVLVYFLLLAVAYGLVALAGEWTPRLGLDLQGGTRITLVTKGDQVSEANLREAARIIDDRVNGSGVSEAEVTTQGNSLITVEIPGSQRADLEETVRRQAQLRFRVVACTSLDGRCGASPDQPQPQDPTQTEPGTGVTVPGQGGGNGGGGKDGKGGDGKNRGGGGSGDQQGSNRPPVAFAQDGQGGGDDQQGGGGQGDVPSDEPTQPDAEAGELAEPLVWMDSPDQKSVRAFQEYQCPPAGETAVVDDDPDKPLVTCDDQGVKYLLSVSMIEGTDLDSAEAGIPDQSRVDWVVSLDFDGDATDTFAEISRTLYGTEKQFAIVLDGQVISAPTMEGIITNGQAQISGNFSEAEATSLATSLKYGALPIQFDDQATQVEEIGATLAGNQLTGGLLAGGFGLALVMVYCLFYYRGLGTVVLASLAVAAASTYAMVLLLSESAGFTLTLPGIAGLIVAVGITADSFIVYFERIRDEMRDGKSMRVAVESGWVRARNTCLAADAVSLLAAVVLYIFAAGVVKGFAFALGLSTLIDLAVFFWFTHPMVSWLARFKFFNAGHKLSGLDAENLGLDRLPVGGRA